MSFNKKSLVIQLMLMVLLVANLIFFMVWQNVHILSLEKRLNDLQHERKNLYNAYYAQIIRYERLSQEARIRSLAKKYLHMKETQPQDFVVLSPNAKKRLAPFLPQQRTSLNDSNDS